MKEYFLNVAGFTLRLSFYPTDHKILQEILIDDIINFWGKGGFLSKKPKSKISYSIKIVPFPRQIKVIPREGARYYHTFKLGKNVLEFYYYVSFSILQMVTKELIYNLLKKDGFILHASSLIDPKGNLLAFLAPQEGGKSTSVKTLTKIRGFEKFGDDNLLIRRIKGRWYFFSPPFIEKDMVPVKKIAKKGTFFFVKKAKKANKMFVQKSKILPSFLKQIWIAGSSLERSSFENAIKFVKENDFYVLFTNLVANDLKKAIYEN